MNDGRLLFTSTRLRLNGKQGILKPESDGSYIMPIGGFNCLNTKGEVYTMENIKEIFESSSELMRKIQNGKCTGEWGHPEPRVGEDMRDFMNRACMVSDKDTCALFKEVWLDDKVARSAAMASYNIAPDTVVTMGRVKPHGLQWEALQRAFDDPDFNVSFSVRNLSTDRVFRGKTYVIIKRIITWDAVADPGVKCAENWLSPRLESRTVEITPTMVASMEKRISMPGMRLESADSLRQVVSEAKRFYANKQNGRPGYADW